MPCCSPWRCCPDLALGVGHRIEPADYPASYAEARQLLEDRDGDVLVLPLSSYRAPAWNHRHLVLDPIGRYLTHDYVASDVLVVDGVPLSGEDPRVRDAAQALAEPTPEERAAALGRIGIGAVVTDPTAPGDPPPEVAGESAPRRPGPAGRSPSTSVTSETSRPAGWLAMRVPPGWPSSRRCAGVLAAVRTA